MPHAYDSGLRELAPGLQVVERPQRFFGLEIGTRMTVLRGPEDALVLHSPVAYEPALAEAIAKQGSIAWIVAPNRFHHLHAGGWKSAHPEAQLLGAPGLAEKRSDLRFDGTLPEDAPPQWAGHFELAWLRAMPLSNEVVLYHRATRTLVTTDLVLSRAPEGPGALAPWPRFMLGVAGIRGTVGTSLLERLGTRDHEAARAFFDEVFAWDFERVVLAHGPVIERGGRDVIREGWKWLWPSA